MAERKRDIITFETTAQINRVVTAERKRLALERGNGRAAGKAEAVRRLVLRGATTTEKSNP